MDDIIDEKFIDDDRLQKECVMYKILNGTFLDPFNEVRAFQPKPKVPPKPVITKQKDAKATKSPGKKRGRKKKNT